MRFRWFSNITAIVSLKKYFKSLARALVLFASVSVCFRGVDFGFGWLVFWLVEGST